MPTAPTVDPNAGCTPDGEWCPTIDEGCLFYPEWAWGTVVTWSGNSGKCWKVINKTLANSNSPQDPPQLQSGDVLPGWEECECVGTAPTTTTGAPPNQVCNQDVGWCWDCKDESGEHVEFLHTWGCGGCTFTLPNGETDWASCEAAGYISQNEIDWVGDRCHDLVQAANPDSTGSSVVPYGSGEECREDEGDAFIVDATLCFGPCPIASGFKGPKGPQGDAGCPACEIKTPKNDIEWKYDDDPCPDATTTPAPATTTCDPNDPNCVPVTTPNPAGCWKCRKTYSTETGTGGVFGSQVGAGVTEEEAISLCTTQANQLYGAYADTITVSVEAAGCVDTTTTGATATTVSQTYNLKGTSCESPHETIDFSSSVDISADPDKDDWYYRVVGQFGGFKCLGGSTVATSTNTNTNYEYSGSSFPYEGSLGCVECMDNSQPTTTTGTGTTSAPTTTSGAPRQPRSNEGRSGSRNILFSKLFSSIESQSKNPASKFFI